MSRLNSLMRHLSSLVQAGVPLAPGCRKLADSSSPSLRPSWVELSEELGQGKTLADSLRSITLSVDPWIADMVTAGEVSGTADHMLQYIVEDLETREHWYHSLGVRMLYPVLLLHMTAFFPAIPIYLNQGSTPALAWILVLLALIYLPFGLLVAAVRLSRLSPAIRRRVESLVYRTPVLGAGIRASVSGRFFRALASLTRASTRWEEALVVAARASNSTLLQEKSIQSQTAFGQGDDLTAVLTRFSFFRSQELDSIATGEITGTLDRVMDRLSENAWSTARERLKVFSVILTVCAYLFCIGGILLTLLVIMGPIYYEIYQLLQY